MLGMLGGLTSLGSSGIGAIGSVLGHLQNAFRFVTAQLTAFASTLLRMIALLGGVVIGGLVAFGTAIGAATKAASEYARTVINLRNQTGDTTAGALGRTQRFGAFGIGAGELANGGQYHGITRMMGRMWGADVNDPASINRRAQAFGGGLMGHAQRGAFLGSIGMDTDNGRFLANLPQAKVQQQMAFQQRLTGQMGVSPQVIQQLAEDLPLLINRFNIFRELLINKIASVALPYITRGFERLSEFLATRGAAIGEMIGRAVEWFMNALTSLSDFLIQQGPRIADLVLGALQFLWADLPVYVVQGMQIVIRGAMSFGETMAGWGHALAEQLRAFQSGEGALYAVSKSIATVLDGIVNSFTHFGAAMAVAASLVQTAAALSPAMQAISVITGHGVIKHGGNPINAARDFYNQRKPSNIAGALEGFRTSGTAGGWADSLDAGSSALSTFVKGHGEAALGGLGSLEQKLGPIAERRAEFQAEWKKQTAALTRIEANTAATAKATEETSGQIGGFARNTISRTLSYVIEDAYLANAAG